MGKPSLLKHWRSPRLSFPIWTAEGSAYPPLMSLWNPSWGPLFSADPLPPIQQLLFQPHPSSCSPHPQPLTLVGLPPPQATRWAPETLPQQKADCSSF